MRRFALPILMVLVMLSLAAAEIPYDAYEAELVKIREQEDLYYQYIENEEFGKAYAAQEALDDLWAYVEVSDLGPVRYLYNAKMAIGDECASDETKALFTEAESLYEQNPTSAAKKAQTAYEMAVEECGYDPTAELVIPETPEDNTAMIIAIVLIALLFILVAIKHMGMMPCCKKACPKKKAKAAKTKKK